MTMTVTVDGARPSLAASANQVVVMGPVAALRSRGSKS